MAYRRALAKDKTTLGRQNINFFSSIECPAPPEVATDFGTDVDLAEKVEASLKLKEAQSTVSVRAALAQEIVKASSEQTRICETLIHDQHLQHQVFARFSRPHVHFVS